MNTSLTAALTSLTATQRLTLRPVIQNLWSHNNRVVLLRNARRDAFGLLVGDVDHDAYQELIDRLATSITNLTKPEDKTLHSLLAQLSSAGAHATSQQAEDLVTALNVAYDSASYDQRKLIYSLATQLDILPVCVDGVDNDEIDRLVLAVAG